MKFTKQENSLIKLAAAHMAPQMIKKATLQDKLAEYGIGLTKQAADAPDYMKAMSPLTGLPNTAPAAKAGARLASRFAGSLSQPPKPGIVQAPSAAPAKATGAPQPSGNLQTGQGTAVAPNPSRLDALKAAFQKKVQDAASKNMQAGLLGYTVGQALRGQTQAPATSQPAAVPAGQMEAQRDPGQKPMIGAPVPTDAKIDPSMSRETQYPYAGERIWGQPWNEVGGYEKAQGNARVFDDALNRVMERNGGVMDQAAVESARKAQATELAKQISAPGTNQYDDAIQMLIQAGRNNQESFENTGSTPAARGRERGFAAPAGYEGKNRLNSFQSDRLRTLFPAMGATGNPQRFASWG